MKISLIITVFNGEKFLKTAIESFLAQDYGDKELIILDGKSTDNSHKIIEIYQKKHKEIKWIREIDDGISDARNIALKHATGDLIGFLGCDDILYKNCYENIFYYANIFNDFDVIYFNSHSVGKKACDFDQSSAISVNVKNLIKHCPIGSGESFYYKKEIFEKYKFNEKNKFSMDYELNFLLATKKKIFYPININGVFNYNHGDNISCANPIKQRLETIAVQLKYLPNILQKFLLILKRRKILLRNLREFLQIKL